MTENTMTLKIKAITDIQDVKHNVDVMNKLFSKLKLPDNLSTDITNNLAEFRQEYEKYQRKRKEGIETKGDKTQVEKSLNSMYRSYANIIKDLNKISIDDFRELFKLDKEPFAETYRQIQKIKKEINTVEFNPTGLKEAIVQAQEVTQAKSLFAPDKGFMKIDQAFQEQNLQKAKEGLADIDAYLSRFGSKLKTENFEKLTSIIEPIRTTIQDADFATGEFRQDLERLENTLQDLGADAMKDFKDTTLEATAKLPEFKSLSSTIKNQIDSEFNFKEQAQMISRQIQAYFGLGQVIRKVVDIAREAFSTVKALDASMTQTAVVTNFSVADMWKALPEYTEHANALGSTIKDVYDAATLYYQQGLNTQQAMGLADETLKMARIAGLDATEATNMMTASLRGFNMEINQTSAKKINDVYSELAAITASDTREIGVAMERTASIANSANMEFATTSAFLAQMIETTREAPESLGTAMKTIVARFQEMKKDPTKLIDAEGVAMDANKVDTALKSIGVSLTNARGEFRNLDDVFLDIAERWDSLSQGQQRYIATIAAGSRLMNCSLLHSAA